MYFPKKKYFLSFLDYFLYRNQTELLNRFKSLVNSISQGYKMVLLVEQPSADRSANDCRSAFRLDFVLCSPFTWS